MTAASHRNARQRDVGSVTLSSRQLRSDNKLRLQLVPTLKRTERHLPATRAECLRMPRPCPYIACRHHLYLSVGKSGSIKLNFPDLEPWELEETCALDVADHDGITLREIGGLLNLTRERVRQLEASALRKLRNNAAALKMLRELAECD